MKSCTRCGELKNLDAFSKRANVRDGRKSRCISCETELHRAWRQANRESLNAARRERRQQNAEQVNAYQRNWIDSRRAADPKAFAAKNRTYNATYRERHRPRLRVKNAAWRIENIETARRLAREYVESLPAQA